jgi:hypothetical protein
MMNHVLNNSGEDEHEKRGTLADALMAQTELINGELPILVEKFKPYLHLGNI